MLRNYLENIAFFRALNEPELEPNTLKAQLELIFLTFELELEFLTNRAEPSFYRAKLELVREQP